MRTLYAACLARLGLSQEDAAELHGVRLDTVRNWATGRRPVPAGAWDELREYAREIQATIASLRAELGVSGCGDVLEAWAARGSTLAGDDRLEPRHVMAFAALLLEPVAEKSSQPLTIGELELNAFIVGTLGATSPASLVGEVLDDDKHPLRRTLRSRDLKELAELREVVAECSAAGGKA